jgi:predicted nucleic acid-binding protein
VRQHCRESCSAAALSPVDADLAMLVHDAPAHPDHFFANRLPEALPIAFNVGRSVYDCLYVAVAVQSETQFITADERLANALAARLPVKWLGAF